MTYVGGGLTIPSVWKWKPFSWTSIFRIFCWGLETKNSQVKRDFLARRCRMKRLEPLPLLHQFLRPATGATEIHEAVLEREGKGQYLWNAL